jgi:hypothetical protein
MHSRSLFYLFSFLTVLLSSCEFSCQVGDSGKDKGAGKEYQPVKKDGALLYNGINLISRRVQVEKAFLVTDEEEATRIGEDNFVDFKKGVKMLLYTGDGWEEVNGKVRIGASLKAVLENGKVLVEEPDLFKSYDEPGIDPKDAKTIHLSLYLKQIWTSQEPVTIKVTFKVWDKQSDAFVEGDYTIHTK